MGMASVSVAAAGLAEYHDEPWHLIVAMVLLGCGVSFAFASMAALITESVRPTETGIATGMNTVMRTVGGVIGGQIGAVLLTAQTLGDGTPAESGYSSAFALSGGAAAVGAVVAIFITSPSWARRRLEAAEAVD
jgi:MFS family permease